ncbi:MAG: DNA repair protein RadC [Alphaproteobacteria bacterium]
MEEATGLSDTELLRALLALALPADQAARAAAELITLFGSYRGTLRAEPMALGSAMKGDMSVVFLLKRVAEAADRLARADLIDHQPVLSSSSKLIGYLRTTMGHHRIEHFRVIYLDPRNAIIADEEQQRGTVDRVQVFPREIMKRALELEATALLLIHNHPSGDPKPSKIDIRMTQEINDAAITLGIALHDHIIVARGGHSSFKAMGLL